MDNFDSLFKKALNDAQAKARPSDPEAIADDFRELARFTKGIIMAYVQEGFEKDDALYMAAEIVQTVLKGQING